MVGWVQPPLPLTPHGSHHTYSQQAGGIHLTGMHSCFGRLFCMNNYLYNHWEPVHNPNTTVKQFATSAKTNAPTKYVRNMKKITGYSFALIIDNTKNNTNQSLHEEMLAMSIQV